MNSPDSAKNFDAYYYAHGCAAPYERSEALLAFFDGIAKRIASDIQPGTVLDAGCALGFLVEALRKLGVQAYGIDVSEYAIQNVDPAIRPYCWTGSIADPFPQHYDLIVSIEVLEHMPRPEAEKAIANLCAHSDDLVFSSTPFDYKEVTHFNVQPPEYWAEQFARQGFVRDVDFDGSFITPWAARFREGVQAAQSRVAHRDARLIARGVGYRADHPHPGVLQIIDQPRQPAAGHDRVIVEQDQEFPLSCGCTLVIAAGEAFIR
ncbi:MAG TPA: class I SAM-dependent methyltransferase [Anaerolineales bacterium]